MCMCILLPHCYFDYFQTFNKLVHKTLLHKALNEKCGHFCLALWIKISLIKNLFYSIRKRHPKVGVLSSILTMVVLTSLVRYLAFTNLKEFFNWILVKIERKLNK